MKLSIASRILFMYRHSFRKDYTYQQTAISTTLGILFGIIPFIGINTVLCTLTALRFKLSLKQILATNYIMFPIQIMLVVPFTKLTAWIFGLTNKLPSFEGFYDDFDLNWMDMVSSIWFLSLLSLLVWSVISLVLSWVLYRIILFYYIPRKPKVYKAHSYIAGYSGFMNLKQI